MLFVADVEASSRWYQMLLGTTSAHGGPEFEMLMLDGSLALQLHRAEAEEHGRRPPGAQPGAGILLYCGVPDIYAAYDRAGEMKAEVESEPTFIEAAGHTEFVVHDPDGYALALFQRGDVKRS